MHAFIIGAGMVAVLMVVIGGVVVEHGDGRNCLSTCAKRGREGQG